MTGMEMIGYIYLGLIGGLFCVFWIGYFFWKKRKKNKHISKNNLLVNSYINRRI